MRIKVIQVSGLGNQLFQYAAGRYYSKKFGGDFRIAVSPAESAVSHGVFARPFLLSHFLIAAPYAPITRLDRAMLSARRQIQASLALLKKIARIEIFPEPVQQRYHFLDSLPIPLETRLLYLLGYWQNYPLVKALELELRSELAFRHPAEGKTLAMQRQIEGTPQSVSLHLRRGDYTLAAEGNIALPLSYYERATAIMESRLGDPTFFIFSDDMGYAREHLPAGLKKVFVDHNDDFSSHEDLRLMSSCQHHIIANSSFSWWGAWLNSDPAKIVVAPRNWLLTEESCFPDLLPPEWIQLNTIRG